MRQLESLETMYPRRSQGGSAFHIAHGSGNHGKLHRESAAEPAADFGIAHFHQFQSTNVGKQFAARAFYCPSSRKPVAAVVKGDLVLETGARDRSLPGDHEESERTRSI